MTDETKACCEKGVSDAMCVVHSTSALRRAGPADETQEQFAGRWAFDGLMRNTEFMEKKQIEEEEKILNPGQLLRCTSQRQTSPSGRCMICHLINCGPAVQRVTLDNLDILVMQAATPCDTTVTQNFL